MVKLGGRANDCVKYCVQVKNRTTLRERAAAT